VVSRSNGEVLRTEPAELYATVTEVRSEGGRTVLVMEGGVTVAADEVTALREAA
jgi:flagellar basal-body rod modification protein FlgD